MKQGEENVRSKLTKDDVKEIYLSSNITQIELARRFNISQSLVSGIKSKRVWSWWTSTFDNSVN